MHDAIGVQALGACVVNQGGLYTNEPPLVRLNVAIHTSVFPVAKVNGPIRTISILVLIMLAKKNHFWSSRFIVDKSEFDPKMRSINK